MTDMMLDSTVCHWQCSGRLADNSLVNRSPHCQWDTKGLQYDGLADAHGHDDTVTPGLSVLPSESGRLQVTVTEDVTTESHREVEVVVRSTPLAGWHDTEGIVRPS